MNLEDRIAWVINFIKRDKKLNNISLSKILGSNKNTIQVYSKGKGDFKGTVLANIVNNYDINSEWLMTGRGEPFPGAHVKHPEVCEPEGFNGAHEITAGYGSGEYVFIKQVNGNISAGGGLIPDNSADIRLAFRKEWFNKKGDPRNISLIKVSGDSMEPTLLSGDLVMVDHSRTDIASQGGIYAISIDHEILIKRLHLLYQDSKIHVISDNKQYPPQEIDANKIIINGKVIWYARELER